MRKLTKADIHPSVSAMSYTEITKIFGKDAEHVAKVMGVKKQVKKKKED